MVAGIAPEKHCVNTTECWSSSIAGALHCSPKSNEPCLQSVSLYNRMQGHSGNAQMTLSRCQKDVGFTCLC